MASEQLQNIYPLTYADINIINSKKDAFKTGFKKNNRQRELLGSSN